MAQTIKDGVVAYNGEVFDNPGLYVCDSSSLPGPAGSPPSMTVAAWSSFIGDQLLKSGSDSAVKKTVRSRSTSRSQRAGKKTKQTN